MLRTVIILLAVLGLTIGCGPPTYETAIAALGEFPGYLREANRDTLQVLARRELPAGDVLVYAFEGVQPDEAGLTCVATTYVGEEEGGRWRAQSSAKLGCDDAYPQPQGTVLAHTAGGNISGLATVFGMAPGGATLRVEWADGLVTTDEIENGIALATRPETVQAQAIEVLDDMGQVLHRETRP